MLGDIGLRDLKKVPDIIDAFFAAQKQLHDVEADGMRQSLEDFRVSFSFVFSLVHNALLI